MALLFTEGFDNESILTPLGQAETTANYSYVVSYNQPPVWVTPSNLGTFNSGSVLVPIAIIATDPEGQSLTYSVVGTLPTGLSYNLQTQILTGTLPLTTTTNYSFTLAVSDGVSTTSAIFSLVGQYAGAPIWQTAAALGYYSAGAVLSLSLIASSPGNYPLIYSWTGGSMPPGVTYTATLLTGTMPLASGYWSFILTVSDGVSNAAQTFTINNVYSGVPVFYTTSLPATSTYNGAVNYSAEIDMVANALSPTTYTQSGFPTGLILTGYDTYCIISGTLAQNTASSLTLMITARNSAGSTTKAYTLYNVLSVSLNYGTLGSVTPTNPLTGVNSPTTFAMVATSSYPGNVFNYQLVSGSLPPNMNLDPTSGIISGPVALASSTSSTTFNFAAVATDIFGNSSVTRNFAIIVNKVAVPVWNTTPGTLGSVTPTNPNTGVNSPTTFTLKATPGLTGIPMYYEMTAGGAPPNMNLDPNSGIISGPVAFESVTATTPCSFTVVAIDTWFNLQSTSGTFTINVNKLPLVWTTATGSLGSVVPGATKTFTLVASSGITGDGVTYSVDSLPPNMGLDPNTGIISGPVVFQSGTVNTVFPINATATDNWFGATIYRAFSITVSPVVLATFKKAAGNLGTLYPSNPVTGQSALTTFNVSATVGITGDTLSYSVATGQLPPGQNLDPNLAIISGPVAFQSATVNTVFSFTIGATDAINNFTTYSPTYSITVAAWAPGWTTAAGSLGSIAPSVATSAKTFTVVATATAYIMAGNSISNYAVTAGALPPNMSLDPNLGIISGPVNWYSSTTNTTFSFTITATDAWFGATSSRNFSIIVTPLVLVTWHTAAGSLGTYAAGSNITLNIWATTIAGDSLYYQFTGTLPNGLSYDSDASVISGQVGNQSASSVTYNFTISATDTIYNVTSSIAYSITATGIVPVWNQTGDLTYTITELSNGTGQINVYCTSNVGTIRGISVASNNSGDVPLLANVVGFTPSITVSAGALPPGLSLIEQSFTGYTVWFIAGTISAGAFGGGSDPPNDYAFTLSATYPGSPTVKAYFVFALADQF